MSRDNYEFFEALAAGGGGGAPTNASYVVIGLNGTLTAERVLIAGSGISITDGGAGGNVTIAATGGGGGANVGTATVDFGAFPGSSHASIGVTGQASIVAGSVVQAWIRPVATADHTADEHMLETIKVFASDIVAGIGFTINVFNAGTINEPGEDARAKDNLSQIAARPGGRGRQDGQTGELGGKGTRIYGQWTIAWSWS